MKFKGVGSARELRSRSVDVIGRPKEEIELDYDPRRDLPPGQIERLKTLAGNIRERTTLLHAPRSLKDAWWLSLFDSEFKELLYSDPEFKDALYANFDAIYTHDAGNPQISMEGVLSFATPGVQLFPALRQVLRKSRVDQLLPRLLKKRSPAPELHDALFKIIPMLVLYPEKREEWLNVYSIEKDTLVARLSAALKEEDTSYGKSSMVADALLVFPELRTDILPLMQDRGNWKSDFMRNKSALDEPGNSFAFLLTVIGAESARIDEKGQIQLQLKPRSMHRAQRSLPERSTA